jgi:hypothetical protein
LDPALCQLLEEAVAMSPAIRNNAGERLGRLRDGGAGYGRAITGEANHVPALNVSGGCLLP